MGDLDAGYPYKRMRRQPDRIRRRGSAPYGMDPMRIWGPHKNSRIPIQESGSGCIGIQFGMIRGSGPRSDPELFAFSLLMDFFTDPDPRIRIRVRVTPNSFRKNLNMIFLEEKRIRATFEWIRAYFYILALKRIRYPV